MVELVWSFGASRRRVSTAKPAIEYPDHVLAISMFALYASGAHLSLGCVFPSLISPNTARSLGIVWPAKVVISSVEVLAAAQA